MNNIKDLLQTRTRKTKAPHELADSVDYIGKRIGFTGRYGYGYWLKKIKKKGLTYFQVKELVDKAQVLPDKYSKGGFLSNQLK